MKTHISLETGRIAETTAFYEKFFGVAPVKQVDDYSLFLLEDPGLELAIDLRRGVAPAPAAHYGLVVDSSADVTRWIERLRTAGLPLEVERDVTCCYAREDKAWVSDPDGRRWEVYTVLEETQARSGAHAGTSGCC